MALEDKKVQPQAELRSGSLIEEELDWPIDAWQAAIESIEEEDDSGVLTTKDIRDHVLKLSRSYSSTVRTRRMIKKWLDNGIIEVADTRRTNILGVLCVQRGFRLVKPPDP